ncbi:carbohydrate ABC transporter permease [Paenibacillus abyssi]|uniref:ABC transporter permease n=1 Tax=Paenibacillus abyssi TaxID=1340531 RepID=A0A917G236_9BACL|nr:carbohydrate ABC transporter permease [Paenibacillus abyssi]GGG19194.1 ABC transporter permease [Paenibacillus abyssi]
MVRSRMKKQWLYRIGLYLLVLFIILETILPFAWLFISSITRNEELIMTPKRWIPEQPTWDRYNSILFGKEISFRGASLTGPAKMFQKSLVNSLLIAGSVTALSLFFGTLAAYAYARLRFRFKNALLMLAIGVQMLPPIAIIIPLYLLLRDLQMSNAFINLILIYCSITVTYVIWIMAGFFTTLPRELEESARIDGCSRLGALFRVLLPISLPGLVATGILSFLTIWNEFLLALVFVNDGTAKTISLAIGEFSTQFSVDYGMMSAGGVIISIPPILLALLFQKYIVAGLTNGAVKG